MARVYRHVLGPDDYVGRVEENGNVYVRRSGIAHDQRIGRVEGEPLVLAGGAAFFLLLSGLEEVA